jgi:hypothetical protein
MDFERDDKNDDFMPQSSGVWWLVLGQRDENKDEFERVGIGYKRSKDSKRDCDLFSSAERKVIRIV